MEGRPYPGHHCQQLPVNLETRATIGCFQTTNLRVPSMESELRLATAQLENRQQRLGLRLLSLPEGGQAREVVNTPTAIGRRLTNTPTYAGRVESTDGSRLDDGTAKYAVVCMNGQT